MLPGSPSLYVNYHAGPASEARGALERQAGNPTALPAGFADTKTILDRGMVLHAMTTAHQVVGTSIGTSEPSKPLNQRVPRRFLSPTTPCRLAVLSHPYSNGEPCKEDRPDGPHGCNRVAEDVDCGQ